MANNEIATIKPTATPQRTVAYNAIAQMREVFLSLVPVEQREEALANFEEHASAVIAVIRDIADERDALTGLVNTAAIAAATNKVIDV